MAVKSFVTNMPDQAGTFLRASQIVARCGGNITRVSYNKAVDPHMLFLDVDAPQDTLRQIESGLSDIGYINEKIIETRVIEVVIRIPDRPGAILPVLEILSGHDINISYMNSSATTEEYQDFKFGLLIENPTIIKTLLDDISRIYPVDVIECDSSEENLDNTVFYIRLANEMRSLLGLSSEKTMRFLAESNRILQVLQAEGEDAGKVFGHIRRFAHTVSGYRGGNFQVSIQKVRLSSLVTLCSIQPYCGSNTSVLLSPGELAMIDTGYAVYTEEMLRVLREQVPDWASRRKRIYITHADVDHCGLLPFIPDAEIVVNRKSAENFKKQADGLPDYREQSELHLGYSKISQIISAYMPPDLQRLRVLDSCTPREHEDLLPIGDMEIGDLKFAILEGSGGHLHGEMVYVCRDAGIVFTGDILVNISGFSKERAEFNSLAPYLMKSVNVNPLKATRMRKDVLRLIEEISGENQCSCLICGGHGPLSQLRDGNMINWNA